MESIHRIGGIHLFGMHELMPRNQQKFVEIIIRKRQDVEFKNTCLNIAGIFNIFHYHSTLISSNIYLQIIA